MDDWHRVYENSDLIHKLKKIGNVYPLHDHLSNAEELIDRLAEADIVIPIRERSKFTREVIHSLPRLKLIAQTGTGIAHIDVNAANEHKLPIAVSPGWFNRLGS